MNLVAESMLSEVRLQALGPSQGSEFWGMLRWKIL